MTTMRRTPKDTEDSHRQIGRRSLVVGGLFLATGAALSLRMRYLQVERAEDFRLLAEENRINIRLMPPARGLIFDRNGVLVAANQQNYRVTLVRDAREATQGADLVTTDVWASMGQEDESHERSAIFAPYQVNAEVMAQAKPDALFLHCLPAHRGEEVTAEVIDGPQSVVWDEAENRLHAQKALIEFLLRESH